MGCACEDGSRDSFYGIILRVDDRESLVEVIGKMKVPDAFREELLKTVEQAPRANFSVLVKMQGGGEMSVGCDMFPQTKEWASERIGKPLHFTITQLPNKRGGGITMDVHELAQKR